jgi:drug/metabolite transporter (DMT)-like permease
MVTEHLGPVFALLTAFSWAIAVVLFKKSGDAIEPIALNLLKNSLGLLLIALSALGAGTSTHEASLSDYAILLASGALGIGIADTLLFAGLNLTGATHQAIVETIYSPSVVVLSYFMLDEVLATGQALGGAFILAAVFIASARQESHTLPRSAYARGLVLGGSSMILMAFAIVWVKPVLERHDVLFSTGVRLTGGLLTLCLMALSSRARRRATYAAFRPQPAWRFAVPGAFLGTYVSLLCWIAAFKYADAGIAALLNQTSTMFIVLLAALFLGERLTARIMVAVGLALTGSVIVLL